MFCSRIRTAHHPHCPGNAGSKPSSSAGQTIVSKLLPAGGPATSGGASDPDMPASAEGAPAPLVDLRDARADRAIVVKQKEGAFHVLGRERTLFIPRAQLRAENTAWPLSGFPARASRDILMLLAERDLPHTHGSQRFTHHVRTGLPEH